MYRSPLASAMVRPEMRPAARSLARPTFQLTQLLLLILVATFTVILLNGAKCEPSQGGEKSEQKDDERPQINRLLIMTAADNYDEGFQRFNQSVQTYNLELTVLNSSLAAGSTGDGGKISRIDLYRKALATHKSEEDLLVLLADDSSHLILNGGKEEILQRFKKFKAKTRTLFSADQVCWPEVGLESSYPNETSGDRYLSSVALIGYAANLWNFLSLEQDEKMANAIGRAKEGDKLQLYCTLAYLNATTRERFALEVDHKTELFQNLHAPGSQVELEFNLDHVKLRSLAYQTEPLVVHSGQGATGKVVLNSLGNYLAKSWTVGEGCRYCNETMAAATQTGKASEMPSILLGIFIEFPTPFLENFFTNILELDYPRERMHLFLHNAIEYHDKLVGEFMEKHGPKYASSQQVDQKANETSRLREAQARAQALERCKEINCDHYLALDSVARLENPQTLHLLIGARKNIVAPLLTRPKKLWSNFWGSLTSDGYYARSHDYVQLVKRERQGIWNVPHVMNAYLIGGNFIRKNLAQLADSSNEISGTVELAEDNNWDKKQLAKSAPAKKTSGHLRGGKPLLSYQDERDPSMRPVLAFSSSLRANDVFQFVMNTHEFGHLVDASSYNITTLHPDLYQVGPNSLDWGRRYLHENYSQLLDEQVTLEKPCPDVSWFPLVNERFCEQLIELMETFGQWSGGTNDDPRIEGGYESVPTRDIHLKQVGLHEMWLAFVREYVMPIQLKEYLGYEHDPPQAELAFVVRYHPQEQPYLRPHHDASTYTLNIALNRPHVDYEGGGCRFVRYNCSVIESRRGWALIHPGRLTHYHEGLPVTNGTRYILVTFVDP